MRISGFFLAFFLGCLSFSRGQGDGNCRFLAGPPPQTNQVAYTFGDTLSGKVFTSTVRVGDPPEQGYEANISLSFCNNLEEDSCVAADPDRFGGVLASIEQSDIDLSPDGFCDGYLATWDEENIMFDYLDQDEPELGVFMQFDNGKVFNCDDTVSTRINLHCSEEGINMPAFSYSSTNNEHGLCEYTIDFHTPEACSGNPQVDGGSGSPSLSGGWVFVIILVISILVYMVVGVLYKSMQMGTSGIESIPNIDFWRSIPQLVREGFAYTRACLCGGATGSYDDVTESHGTYNQAAGTGADDVYNPISGTGRSSGQTF